MVAAKRASKNKTKTRRGARAVQAGRVSKPTTPATPATPATGGRVTRASVRAGTASLSPGTPQHGRPTRPARRPATPNTPRFPWGGMAHEGGVVVQMFVGHQTTLLYSGSPTARGLRGRLGYAAMLKHRCDTYKGSKLVEEGISQSYMDKEFPAMPHGSTFALAAFGVDSREAAPARGPRKSVLVGYIKGQVFEHYSKIEARSGSPGASRVFLVDLLCGQGENPRKGVGGLLLDVLESIAIRAGARMMVLYSVFKPETYAFYKNRGYVRSADACTAGTPAASPLNAEAVARYARLQRTKQGVPRFTWPAENGHKEQTATAWPAFLAAMEHRLYVREPFRGSGDVINRWNDYVLMTKCLHGRQPRYDTPRLAVRWDATVSLKDGSRAAPFADQPRWVGGKIDKPRAVGLFGGNPWARLA